MNNIRFAIIGLGNRGWSLMRNAVMPIDGVEIVGVCDLYPDRCERARAYVAEKAGIETRKILKYCYARRVSHGFCPNS